MYGAPILPQQYAEAGIEYGCSCACRWSLELSRALTVLNFQDILAGGPNGPIDYGDARAFDEGTLNGEGCSKDKLHPIWIH